MHMLNAILAPHNEVITAIQYMDTDILGAIRKDRKAVYDLLAKTQSDTQILIEVQNTYQRYFSDRTDFYGALLQTHQAKQGIWNYKLDKIYVVSFVNFTLFENRDNPDKYITHLKMMDMESHKPWRGKLTQVYVEVPKLHKELKVLENPMEKWIYYMQRIQELKMPPQEEHDPVFQKLLNVAKVANLSKKEAKVYIAV